MVLLLARSISVAQLLDTESGYLFISGAYAVFGDPVLYAISVGMGVVGLGTSKDATTWQT